MKRITLLLACIIYLNYSYTQSYNIGHRRITWADSSRNNRPVKFEVYYPASVTGDNAAVINNGKKFPLVVFGHGYQLTYRDYLWLKDSLVPKGFFLVFPGTEEQLFPKHTDFAKDYAFIINRFDVTKTTQGLWYYNRIKNSYAVSGHSMGGGCSLLSVQYSKKITAVFNFAAAETNPSAIAACSGIAIPALIFAGGKDCISPPSSNQLPMYNNIQPVCKTFVQITNGKHCHWAKNSSTCRAGELSCSPASSSPKPTLATTFSLLLPWLNDKLNGNTNAAGRFQQLLTSSGGITYRQDCASAIDFLNPTSNNARQVKVYPSNAVAGTVLNIVLPQLQQASAIGIYDQSGKEVFAQSVSSINASAIKFSTAGFKKGIYFIVVRDGMKLYKSSFILN